MRGVILAHHPLHNPTLGPLCPGAQQIGARSVPMRAPQWVVHREAPATDSLGSGSTLRKTPKSKACAQGQQPYQCQKRHLACCFWHGLGSRRCLDRRCFNNLGDWNFFSRRRNGFDRSFLQRCYFGRLLRGRENGLLGHLRQFSSPVLWINKLLAPLMSGIEPCPDRFWLSLPPSP